MKVIALLCTFNEEYFIKAALENLFNNNILVYLIDNESIDETVNIAQKYMNDGLLGIETLPRGIDYNLLTVLERKTTLVNELEADWFIHADTDEFLFPLSSAETLRDALGKVDQENYNAVNFYDYTFFPTKEKPEHFHNNFQETMLWYRAVVPREFNKIIAWKKQLERVEIICHNIYFSNLKIYPENFILKHYPILSLSHALKKYRFREFDPVEIMEMSWHRKRNDFYKEDFEFPSENELKKFSSNQELNNSEALKDMFSVFKRKQ
ncbi:glycosyltransferase family 2 protein [Candidatus Dependentiae bacterium]|nr:glycosyltransferase family 2 protein [Candidatus Dependentiae bacterium]